MPATRDLGAAPAAYQPATPLQRTGALHVLVIGINAYEHWNPLQCAVQDAEAVAEVLMQRYGVRQEHVVRLLDKEATADNLDRALRAYRKGGARALSADDDLLIFYAGHGHLDTDANLGYWIPVDASTDAAGQWIPNSQIKAHLRALDARHVLIISDSCFSGDFLRRDVTGDADQLRRGTDWLAQAYGKASRHIISSGGLEPVSDAGLQGHSVFTHFLLKALRENSEPYLLPVELYRRVHAGVVANAAQMPQIGFLSDAGGEVGGEFVLFLQENDERLLRRREEQLAQLHRRQEELEADRRRQQEEERQRQQRLQALDEEIRKLQQQLQEMDSASAENLDALHKLVQERARQARELQKLRLRQAEEERARKAEMARLHREAEQKRRAAFDADWEKYLAIVNSRHATAEIRQKAWEALLQRWEIHRASPGHPLVRKPVWKGKRLVYPHWWQRKVREHPVISLLSVLALLTLGYVVIGSFYPANTPSPVNHAISSTESSPSSDGSATSSHIGHKEASAKSVPPSDYSADTSLPINRGASINAHLVRTLSGHHGGVSSVSFSPDGRWLASGSWDGIINLWEVETGRLMRTLTGHYWWPVNSLSFSPDGRWLATGGDNNKDRGIKLWEVKTGRLFHAMKGRGDKVFFISFSPDSRWLAAGYDDGTVKLWKVESGVIFHVLKGHRDWVNAVSFSPDGRWLASGSDDKTIKLWEVKTGRLIRTMRGHNRSVNFVSFSPDGRWLASGSDDRTIKLWEVETGRLIRTLKGHEKRVNSVSFSPDSRWIASGSDDRTIKLWEVKTGHLIRSMRGHDRDVNSVSFSPDGRWLASGSSDKTIRLWKLSLRPVDVP